MIKRLGLVALCLASMLFAGCSQPQKPAESIKAEQDDAANALYEEIFQEWLARSPTFQTWLGIKTDYDKWDNLSESFGAETHALLKKQLERLRDIDRSALSEEVALSYRLMEETLEQDIDFYRWRDHNYPVNQMFGWHSRVPSLLINQHTVTNVDDAEAYIARINAVPELFEQLVSGLYRRADKGIIAPKFVFPMVIDDSQNIIAGAPFDEGDDSAIYKDFKEKLSKLELEPSERERLESDAEDALVSALAPAYRELILALEDFETRADDRAGVWTMPNGEAFYEAALKQTTTTNLSANAIHELGLSEVKRIHGEMRAIVEEVGFEGDLQAFFKHLKEDDRYYYPNSDKGREQYLQRTAEVLDEMTARLDEVVTTQPSSELKVKAVEAFREKSAGKAFYQSPPPDGSRRGIYYVNLYNMKEMPKYELEALAYHEGVPGHHLQLSIATEIEGLPKFRKFGHYTAYSEGWGLYAEYLPKEMGLYRDSYSDFGRLAMELWRACRLVVDTGIHAKKWTREEAIDYLIENTPNADRGSRRAIERYIVMPSQATAYKIGMLKILELRENAREALGDAFDIRAYHEKVLMLGPVPLNVLEEQIDQWIAERQIIVAGGMKTSKLWNY